MGKIRIHPDWYLLAIWCIAIFLILLYIRYFRKDSAFSDFWLFFKIVLIGLFLIGFLLIFMYEIVVIYISIGKETGTESWIFLVLNVLLLGIYINVCGFRSKSTNAERYLFLSILVILSLSGLGYLGLLIKFNPPISDYLLHDIYQSNSVEGIYFFTYNFLLFTLIYFLSFITEKENEA